MSVCKHVLVAFALITACGHLQASGPVPTAAAATAMFYGIEMPDAAVAELAEVAPVAASVLLTARRSEEHTSELQSLMRTSYAVFCLNKKKDSLYFRNNTYFTKTQLLYIPSIRTYD